MSAGSPFLAVPLLVMACSLVVIAAAAVLMARDVRRSLRRLDAFLRRSQRIVRRADRLSAYVEGAVQHACKAAQGALNRWAGFTTDLGGLFGNGFRHGAGKGSRRHVRG